MLRCVERQEEEPGCKYGKSLKTSSTVNVSCVKRPVHKRGLEFEGRVVVA